MSPIRHQLLLALAALALAACSGAPGTRDAGADGASDAGTSDAGPSDGGTSDAGVGDAGTSDAGTSDGGTSDAGAGDAGTSDAGTDAGQASLGLLSAVELHDALLAKDFLMIDVHIPYAGVIPGTDTSIPYNDVPALVQYIGADLNRKVVLTCYSGGMSTQAGNALVGRGYRAVRHLQGGMVAWTAAGYPLQ